MIDNNDFYWLQDKFITDRKLWGDFVNNPKLGGSFSSPIENIGIDFRIYHGDLELTTQYYENRTGFGAIYPLDKTAPQSLWVLPVFNIYGRYLHRFTDNFFSTTMMRFRKTDLSSESYDLEGYNIVNNGPDNLIIGGGDVVAPGETVRVVQLLYWQAYNSSYTVSQNFEWSATQKLTFNVGVKFEDKNLQKAYDLNKGAWYYPDSLTSIIDALPQYSNVPLQSANRVNWLDKGAFLQGKYRISEKSILNLGFRVDENSVYGISPTLRAGFVHTVGKMNLKLLYGQAYQEPSPRNLYGNWIGSGADPDLKPEKSQTGEINVSYSRKSSNQLFSFWWVNNTNTIVNLTGGAQNLGERNVIGIDYLMQMDVPIFKKTNVQVYYSLILLEEEEKFDSQGMLIGVGNIGDLSHHKIHFGITSYILKNLVVNFKGQYRGQTDLVSTNPLKTMPDYFVIDGNLTWRDFAVKGISLSLKVVNIFNTKYYHPGLRNANSGKSGGLWNGRAWEGSSGWYNSLIPQPRRCVILSLNIQV